LQLFQHVGIEITIGSSSCIKEKHQAKTNILKSEETRLEDNGSGLFYMTYHSALSEHGCI